MKAIAITAYGGREQLTLMELPEPVPGPGEVLIRIRASGVNPVDHKIRRGLLATRMPNHFPLIIGLECAGEVAAVGPGVSRVRVGDAVMAYARKAFLRDGTYAEFIVLPEASLTLKPARLTFEQAAALPLAGLTSYQALFELGGLAAGQTVLIHAGAGGTGGYGLQLARHAGARVITTARAVNHDYVRARGADAVVDYTREDFRLGVRRWAPAGVDLAYDTIGGEVQVRSAEVVRPDGLLVSLIAFADEAALKARGIRTQYLFVRPQTAQLDELARLAEAGVITPDVTTVLPLVDAARAHELIEGGHTRGKVVLQVA